MTLLNIAREHCANWRSDGKGCLGAIIDDDLQIRRCCPKPACVLAEVGQRCGYFEECVMPVARSIDNPAYRQGFEEALRQYKVAAKLPRAAERPCPDCGQAMKPRRRFCHECASKKHRANQRTWAAKQRALMKTARREAFAGQQAVERAGG